MTPKPSSDSGKPEAKGKFPTEIVVAVLGLAGVAITAYFGYLQIRAPYEISLRVTQTAEARATLLALSATPTPKPETPTLIPSPTATTPTLTPTIAGQPGGERYCINVRSIYVREGPGTDYSVVGGLTFEDCLYFDARFVLPAIVETETGALTVDVTWLRISANQPRYAELEGGWVRADLLRPEDYEQLPSVTLTPTPTSTPEPTATPTPLG